MSHYLADLNGVVDQFSRIQEPHEKLSKQSIQPKESVPILQEQLRKQDELTHPPKDEQPTILRESPVLEDVSVSAPTAARNINLNPTSLELKTEVLVGDLNKPPTKKDSASSSDSMAVAQGGPLSVALNQDITQKLETDVPTQTHEKKNILEPEMPLEKATDLRSSEASPDKEAVQAGTSSPNQPPPIAKKARKSKVYESSPKHVEHFIMVHFFFYIFS